METSSEAYKKHLENKYLPGRSMYLRSIFYPKILKEFDSGRIVDLGCGTGEFLKFLQTKKQDFSGIDNNPYLVKKCIDMGFKVNFDDVTKLESIQQASVENAMCDNVLEHLDLEQINDFFVSIKPKMVTNGKLVVIVPAKKGFEHDPTHKTYVNQKIIETICAKYEIQLKNHFFHPVNISFAGNFFYLNMQVYTLTF
jgi:trans-aconitate methyltransferase